MTEDQTRKESKVIGPKAQKSYGANQKIFFPEEKQRRNLEYLKSSTRQKTSKIRFRIIKPAKKKTSQNPHKIKEILGQGKEEDKQMDS